MGKFKDDDSSLFIVFEMFHTHCFTRPATCTKHKGCFLKKNLLIIESKNVEKHFQNDFNITWTRFMHYNHWYSIALLSQKVSKQFYLKDPKKGINLPGDRARCRRLRCQNEGGIIYSSDLNFIHAIIGFTQTKHQIIYILI